MGFNRFSILVTVRIALLALTLLGLMAVAVTGSYPVLSGLILLIAIAQLVEVIRYVRKTNKELSRFLDAARYADYGQRFDNKLMGTGFDELGQVFADILKRFQQSRNMQEEEYRYLKALIEHVPVPSMSVQTDGTMNLHNNAARRMFGNHTIENTGDLQQFGADFANRVEQLSAGERDLVSFKSDEIEKHFTIAAAQITIGNRIEKLISLQDIQPELDDAQLQAWQALVKVLTHEIMNSITPIASLSKTTTGLVQEARQQVSSLPNNDITKAVQLELDDVQQAVDTIAHRSDSLTQFVQSYRQLTRLPQANKTQLIVRQLLNEVALLVTSEWNKDECKVNIEVEPKGLALSADADMMQQVLINLMRNAKQAIDANPPTENGHIVLRSRLNQRGHIVIEVIDNGPGINDDVANNVFVPFFTTKREGSGVGLALTRQIMTAHGGTVSIGEMTERGARIVLTF